MHMANTAACPTVSDSPSPGGTAHVHHRYRSALRHSIGDNHHRVMGQKQQQGRIMIVMSVEGSLQLGLDDAMLCCP